jgi:hypothetical protein
MSTPLSSEKLQPDGRACYELRPVFEAVNANLKRSFKQFMDENRAPVLDPGSRKTETGSPMGRWRSARCRLHPRRCGNYEHEHRHLRSRYTGA